jgi:CBS domain-containing protein
MMIAGILRQKGGDVVSVAPTHTIDEVCRLLGARRIGAVLVTDPAGHLLGILSERDIVRALPEHGAATLALTAADLMTADVETAHPHTSVEEAMEIMTHGRFRHLPVLEDGALAGLVSIGDIVKARLDEQSVEVDSLKAYVAGVA